MKIFFRIVLIHNKKFKATPVVITPVAILRNNHLKSPEHAFVLVGSIFLFYFSVNLRPLHPSVVQLD